MTKISRNFLKGRMNKIVDERMLPDGEYIDAMNLRMGSTEMSEIGVVTNTKGNLPLTNLSYIDGNLVSINARCIGAIEDSANETIYWFVHDPSFTTTSIGPNPTGKLDLIVSLNILTNILTYHVVSINDGSNITTTLNFNKSYLITGVNLIDNLLFWTDNYNPPRFISLNRNYPNPILDVDQVSYESLLVIKKPPIESPKIQPISTNGQENFLETRFICFAYRYKYIDGEYSATSQWSEPSFIPGSFRFSTTSVLNEGMVNSTNAVIVTYNSGGPLVIGIDLLFKQSENNIIKIIEKINKEEQGIFDNQLESFTFNNSKIFTVLNEAEILRLYDNVPLIAKAQTIMGNRLMYGNYLEGYNLIDKINNPLRLEYETKLISKEIGLVEVTDGLGEGVYNIDPTDTGFEVPDSILTIDFTGVSLTEGASINIDIRFTHALWSGYLPVPDEQTDSVELTFNFILTTSYSSVYEMATSPEFIDKIGTPLNILPVFSNVVGQETSCEGDTLTDDFNCQLPFNLGSAPDTYTKYGSGINGVSEPIKIISTPASSVLSLQFPSMLYVDNTTTPTKKVYEYYRITFAAIDFQKVASPKSLHSNRGYEIGIVYMDEFNRSTTALVSPYNAVYVPCGLSLNQNSIQITIPIEQRAPYWAKRYKFVIKPDEERYETVYSYIYFNDPDTNQNWLLLEGENMQKVENGDRLIVKADNQGPTLNCVYTTVLEKVSKESGFLEIPSQIDPLDYIKVPSGVYMRLNPNNFDLSESENAIVELGKKSGWASGGDHKQMPYTVNIEGTDPSNPTWTHVDFNIPAGSIINWFTDWNRAGTPRNCGRRGYTLEKIYGSSSDYDNLYEWFIGENIQLLINSGVDKGDEEKNVFIDGLNRKLTQNSYGNITTEASGKIIDSTATFITDGVVPGVTIYMGSYDINVINVISETELDIDENYPFNLGAGYMIKWVSSNINFWRFYRDPTTNELSLYFSSTYSCYGRNYRYSRRIYITAEITIFRAENTAIFETMPSDALPDVFFENDLSFEIDDYGNHLGNVVDQDISAGIAGIIDTKFFNCFSFGNGVESYKIRDSIIGKSFNLGERVNTVNSQDFKSSHRFSDITYSGIYNEESNINKLNQFNLGLSNYKRCEASFGPIMLLDGRSTDVLVLQEDKISYVLTEKNLLSDASAGGIITASPEVLGTQMARTEKYGISFNPESYIQWGGDRFFTDVKRGSVIQLKGGDTGAEQLLPISNQNMRTWFRDTFNESFNFQKLGAFDPYMNEYVLSMNDQLLPINPSCIACGVTKTFTLSVAPPDVSKTFVYCVDLGPTIGISEINWTFTNIQAGATLNVSVNYNGTIVSSGNINTSGLIIFNKNQLSVETAEITLTYTGDMLVSINAECVTSEILNIIEVVLTNNLDAGKTIHNEYRYTNGSFIGPLFSHLVVFSSGTGIPLVSRYNMVSGYIGSAGFPPAGSQMKLSINKIGSDDYVFNPAEDKFRYLRTPALYENNDLDMQDLISNSLLATPIIGATPIYSTTFIVPPSIDGEYLYLIYDLRDFILIELCFAENVIDACCDCTPGNYYINGSSFITATNVFVDSDGGYITAPNGFYSQGGIVRELVNGILLPQQPCNACSVEVTLCFGISAIDVCCNCQEECNTPYNTYEVTNNSGLSQVIGYYNENGIYQEITLDTLDIIYICSIGAPTSSNEEVVVVFSYCGCTTIT